MESRMETEIGSLKVYPPKTPISCDYRVWITNMPYCTFWTGSAVTVTETEVNYAPLCSHKECARGGMDAANQEGR